MDEKCMDGRVGGNEMVHWFPFQFSASGVDY